MSKNILFIAPHPDDEVLGCGGIIRRFANEGNQVFVLIASRGCTKLFDQSKVENVRLEAKEAHKLLGVTETFFLEYPAPELDTVPIADLSRDFSKIIADNKINILFLPHRGDIHNDHKVVFNAGLVAARPVGCYTVTEIYCYETLSETEWAAPFGDDAFIPNFFVNIEETYTLKVKALTCFKSQLRKFPNPRSLETIEALAKFRGATVGFKMAEAFMIIRQVKS
jgi:LmbE family N-acetylglucosaminyl deacetylase